MMTQLILIFICLTTSAFPHQIDPTSASGSHSQGKVKISILPNISATRVNIKLPAATFEENINNINKKLTELNNGDNRYEIETGCKRRCKNGGICYRQRFQNNHHNKDSREPFCACKIVPIEGSDGQWEYYGKDCGMRDQVKTTKNGRQHVYSISELIDIEDLDDVLDAIFNAD